MEQTDSGAPPAASPAAPVSAQSVMDSLSGEERSTWEQTGDLPARVKIAPTSDASAASSPASTDAQASSPATPVDPAASTDASTPPASEPGPPAETPEKPEKGAKLKARTSELEEENRRLHEQLQRRRELREELARLERPKPDEKAESSPAAPTGEWDGSDPRDPKPKDVDFDDHNAYMDARDAWNERRFGRKAQAQREIEQRVTGFRQISESATQRIQDYAKANPGFEDRVRPELLDIQAASFRRMHGQPIGPPHILAEEILKSDHTGQLLEHFSTDDGAKDWHRLCALPPADRLRAFGRIEARFDGSATAAPAPKTVSSAPAPPVTLGSRTADTADPLEAALKRKDTTAYIREANRRDLAAMGL